MNISAHKAVVIGDFSIEMARKLGIKEIKKKKYISFYLYVYKFYLGIYFFLRAKKRNK